MAIGGLGGFGLAGLSGIAQGLADAQKQHNEAVMAAYRQQQLQDLMDERKASAALYPAILGGGLDSLNPTMAGGQPMMPGQGSTATSGYMQPTGGPSGPAALNYSPTPQGSGMASGLPRGGGGGERLSFDQMNQLALDVGFTPDKAPIMAATLMAESGGNPYAYNPKDPQGSYGIGQINQAAHGPVAREGYGNARRSMELAYQVSNGGTNFSPWTMYKNGGYQRYLPSGGGYSTGVGRPSTAAPTAGPPSQMANSSYSGGGTQTQAPTTAGESEPGLRSQYDASVQRFREQEARAGDKYAPSKGPESFEQYQQRFGGPQSPGTKEPPLPSILPAEATSGSTGPAAAAAAVATPTPAPAAPSPGAVSETGIALPGDETRAPGAAPQPGQAPQARPPAAAMPRLMATAPPPVQQQVQQTAVQTATSIPQAAWGRMSLTSLAQQIEKSNPGLDPVVKMMALEKAQKLLAPSELRMWEMFKLQHGDAIHLADQQFQRETALLAEERAQRATQQSQQFQIEQQQRGFEHTDTTGGQLVVGTAPDGTERIERVGKGGVTTPINTGDLSNVRPFTGAGSGDKTSNNITVTDENGKPVFQGAAHQVRGTAGESVWINDSNNQRITVPQGGNIVIGNKGAPGTKTSKNITVTDGEGKTIFQGAAHQVQGVSGESAWVSDKDNKPVVVPDDGNLLIAGTGEPGKQAAGQMIRLTGAANEARAQIANVARATKGTTTGMFQGVQAMQGKDLVSGVTRVLANRITPRDAQIMTALGNGIGRSLATLQTGGAATGLVNLQESFQREMPQGGDDNATALIKIANMRQIAEQAIEASMTAPGIGKEQKELLAKVREDITKAVPFTVGQVLDLIQDPGQQTWAGFAASIGLGPPANVDANGNRIP